MDHPLQDPRVGGVDLTAQFPFTRRVGGEGGTDKVIQSRYIKNAINGACSLLNPMGSFQFSSTVSGTVDYSHGVSRSTEGRQAARLFVEPTWILHKAFLGPSPVCTGPLSLGKMGLMVGDQLQMLPLWRLVLVTLLLRRWWKVSSG